MADELKIVQAVCIDKKVWQLGRPAPDRPDTKVQDMIALNNIVEIVLQNMKDPTRMPIVTLYPPIVTILTSMGSMSAWQTAISEMTGQEYMDLDEATDIQGKVWRVGGPVPGDDQTLIARIVRVVGSDVVEIFASPLAGTDLEKANIALHFTLMPLTVVSTMANPTVPRAMEIVKLMKELQTEEDYDEEDDEEDDEQLDDQIAAATAPTAPPAEPPKPNGMAPIITTPPTEGS